MGLAYNVLRSKHSQGEEGRTAKVHHYPDEGPQRQKPRPKLVRDENGAIIKVPKRRPHQNRKTLDRWSEAPCMEGEPAYWGGITREELDRMQWLLDLNGQPDPGSAPAGQAMESRGGDSRAPRGPRHLSGQRARASEWKLGHPGDG